MLICTDCGAVFTEDELETIQEPHPYGMGYAVEEFSVCPNCGECGVEEAVRCSHCGEYGCADNFTCYEVTDQYLCDICYGDLNGE